MVLLIIIILFRAPFFGLVPLSLLCAVQGGLIDRSGVTAVGVLGLGC